MWTVGLTVEIKLPCVFKFLLDVCQKYFPREVEGRLDRDEDYVSAVPTGKGEGELKCYPRKLTAICSTSEEAEAEYGKDKIKAYKTSFTNMYHALTHRKTSTMMKLVCLLPEEKVTTF